MFNFIEGLCSCFNPEIKQNIIEYLSSAKLNRQVIEQQKCSQENQAPQQSIYAQVKTKSYYFMKLKQQQEIPHEQPKQQPISNYDPTQQPNYYPQQHIHSLTLYDQLYIKKLQSLKKILKEQLDATYSKIYDSQDEINLKIYCRQEIYQSKRFNSYRFSFKIHHHDHPKLEPKDYLDISLNQEKTALHQPLLKQRTVVQVTEGKIEIVHRCYKKILVINQHDFYTAEKCEVIEEEGKEVVYSTVFSVKGDWPKLVDYSRGWVNLTGLRISQQKAQFQEPGTSLREQQTHILIEGYINVELQIGVNANMLKQPIAKQIRVYVQKLMSSLIKSDAI